MQPTWRSLSLSCRSILLLIKAIMIETHIKLTNKIYWKLEFNPGLYELKYTRVESGPGYENVRPEYLRVLFFCSMSGRVYSQNLTRLDPVGALDKSNQTNEMTYIIFFRSNNFFFLYYISNLSLYTFYLNNFSEYSRLYTWYKVFFTFF